MSFERFFNDITSLYGSRAAVARLLGVGQSALSNYHKRGQMPAGKLQLLADDLARKGYHLDKERFDMSQIEAVTPSRKPICLLIITGGIAAYKSLELARRLMDEGYIVRGVMTASAQQFITPLSLSALTAEKVYTDLFSLTDEQEMGHIRLAREADKIVIAPATGNFLAKVAMGLADDLATTLCLASDAPLYFVPAMNPVMWAQPATQANCALLKERGAIQIGPDVGDTACGEVGAGRMASTSDIIAALSLSSQPATGVADHQGSLYGKHVLITAGPTQEPIDGVRYISNSSSGKQGYAIAAACVAQGAEVTLVTGPTSLPVPDGVHAHHVLTANQMHEASLANLPADIAICTAAVADWHVVGATHQKMKKTDESAPPMLELAENPDILKEISAHPQRPDLVIGFAAETDNVINAAVSKRLRKGCDWMMANEITTGENVFGSDHNQLIFIRDGEETTWPNSTKSELAERLVAEIASHFAQKVAL